jgi:cadmium-exporting ATPase
MIPGRGVAAKVEGYHALAGNRAMLNENNITFPQQMTTQAEEFINRGCTMIYISLDSLFIGYVVLSDTIRSESVGTIKVLEALNVQPVLLPVIMKKRLLPLQDSLVFPKFKQTVCRRIS